ncbi:MAG: MFS transporter [Rhodococcus sp. (in: high G+C Gram-positive bacteria)]|nr:MAG: MFS transporter [Rhodococcus sp. (in: high G+C Gram-positive bacteria)]
MIYNEAMPQVRPSRTSTQLILDRDFGTLFWGKIGSLIATWAFTIILVTVTYDATGSAKWSGVVSAALMAPQLVVTLGSGSLSDSRGERLPIILGGILCSIGALTLSFWLFLADVEGEEAVVPLLVCAVVSGCGVALFSPALQSVVTRLVRPDELSTAVSLNFFPTALARTVGPAGGALVLAWFGAIPSVLVVGIIYVLSTAAFIMVRVPPSDRKDGDDVRVWSAIRYVVRDRVILYYLVGVAAIGAGAEPAITLAPAIASSVDHHGSAGWVVAAFGAGGLLGVLVHRTVQNRVAPNVEGYAAMTILAVMMALASFSERLDALLVLMVVAGCSMVVGITAFSVAVQQRCSSAMLGRVMAMWVLAFAGVRPLAALTIGFVTEQLSLMAALLGTGAMLVLTALALAAAVARARKRRVAVSVAA